MNKSQKTTNQKISVSFKKKPLRQSNPTFKESAEKTSEAKPFSKKRHDSSSVKKSFRGELNATAPEARTKHSRDDGRGDTRKFLNKKTVQKPVFVASNKKDNNSEKLQKILAEAGMGSRREMEKLIEEGQVRLNGKVAKLGDRALPQDRISVKNRLLTRRPQFQPKLRVLMYNKPDTQICTSKDEEGRETVFESLPMLRNGRWIMVGRLDLNTSGLLLFTNNGDLAYRLMHPKYAIEREYAVRVLGKVDAPMLERLKKGVMLEDGEAKFDQIHFSGGEGANSWYHVVLHEGKNKEVRRLWESQGVTVSRLTRVRYGQLTLPPYLKMGRWQELEGNDLKGLLRQVDL